MATDTVATDTVATDTEQATVCQKFQNLPSEFQVQTIVKIIRTNEERNPRFTVNELKNLRRHVSHKLNTITIRLRSPSNQQNYTNLLTTTSDFEKISSTYTLPIIISLLPTFTNVQVMEIHVAIYYELKRQNSESSSCCIC